VRCEDPSRRLSIPRCDGRTESLTVAFGFRFFIKSQNLERIIRVINGNPSVATVREWVNLARDRSIMRMER